MLSLERDLGKIGLHFFPIGRHNEGFTYLNCHYNFYFRDLPMNSEKDPPNNLPTSLRISFRVGRHPETNNFSYSLASTLAMTDLL